MALDDRNKQLAHLNPAQLYVLDGSGNLVAVTQAMLGGGGGGGGGGGLTNTELRAAPLSVRGTRANAGTDLAAAQTHCTVGGSDGTNLRPIALDGSGRVVNVGAAAVGAAAAGNPVYVAGLVATSNPAYLAGQIGALRLSSAGVLQVEWTGIGVNTNALASLPATLAAIATNSFMRFTDGTNWLVARGDTQGQHVKQAQGTVAKTNVTLAANTATTPVAANALNNGARIVNYTASPLYVEHAATGTPSAANGSDYVPAAASGVPGQWECPYRPVDGLRIVGASAGQVGVWNW